MQTRSLTEEERAILLDAMSKHVARIQEEMEFAAGDRDMVRLRAALANYDLSTALGKLLAKPCRLVAIQ